MKRLALIAATAALLAGAVVAYANLARLGTPSYNSEEASRKIRIGGHANGLFPGGQRVLRAKVYNRTRREVILRRLRVVVGDAGPGCGSANLLARNGKRKRPIPPHSKRKVKVKLTLSQEAPDDCAGARFPLHFRARFVRPR